MKKLYRSSSDRVISGVCGGLAKYLDTDSTLIRVVLVIAVLLGGIGLVAYIVGIFIIPEEPFTSSAQKDVNQEVFVEDSAEEPTKTHSNDQSYLRTKMSYVAGFVLVVLGIIALMSSFGWFSLGSLRKFFWPALLIIFGVLFLFRLKNK